MFVENGLLDKIDFHFVVAEGRQGLETSAFHYGNLKVSATFFSSYIFRLTSYALKV